ncbi:MAG: hypothetical protein HYY62_02345, partial [Deltaproteobacteria bacterium]|nr:hypothetical protein [Deltaproteobacteria bacterium]
MKRLWIFLLWSILSTSLYAGGGSDASGGGDIRETQILEGKILAIDALRGATKELLSHQGLVEASFIDYFMSIRDQLLSDLSHPQSKYRIYKKDPSRLDILVGPEGETLPLADFIIDEYEKTFITKHRPSALIQINLSQCIALNIQPSGYAILFIRDTARHLAIQDPLTLQKIEHVAIILIREVLKGQKMESQVPTSVEAPSISSLPFTMTAVSASPSDSLLQVSAFELSEPMTKEAYANFLNLYSARYPDRRDPKTHDVLDQKKNKFLSIYGGDIEYETSLNNAWNNRRSFWNYLGPFALFSWIQEWIETERYFVRYDHRKSSTIGVSWQGAKEFCAYYGLELPTELQIRRASELGFFKKSGAEWLRDEAVTISYSERDVSNPHLPYATPSYEDFRCVKEISSLEAVASSLEQEGDLDYGFRKREAPLRKIRFDALENTVQKRYISEDFFHYYLQADVFSKEEEALIHEAYKRVSQLLQNHGLPVTFTFQGYFQTQMARKLPQVFYGNTITPLLEIEHLDKKNVIYRIPSASSNSDIRSHDLSEHFSAHFSHPGTWNLDNGRTQQGEVSTGTSVEVASDIFISDHMKESPYTKGRESYPCLCFEMTERILDMMKLSSLFNFRDSLNVHPHVHFKFPMQEARVIQKLEESLDKITIVQSPVLDLLAQNSALSIYKTTNGIYAQLNDAFRKQHYEEGIGEMYPLFDMRIKKENNSAIIAKTEKPGYYYTDRLSQKVRAMQNVFFALPNVYWDSMLEAVTVGELRETELIENPPAGTSVVLELFHRDHP